MTFDTRPGTLQSLPRPPRRGQSRSAAPTMALPVLPIILPAIAAAWAMSTSAFQVALEKGISAAIYYFLEIILMKGYVSQVLTLGGGGGGHEASAGAVQRYVSQVDARDHEHDHLGC